MKMKKAFPAFLLALIFAVSALPVSAVGEKAWKITFSKDDLNGKNGQVYLSGCRGHYDAAKDTATVTVTNAADGERKIQIIIGWNETPDTVQTTVRSEVAAIKPGESETFALTGLSKVHEKKNVEPFYEEDRFLGETSIVRVAAEGILEGDTIYLSGFSAVNGIKGNALKEFHGEAVVTTLPGTTGEAGNTDVQQGGQENEQQTEKLESAGIRSYLLRVAAADVPGGKGQFYLSGCTGHYDAQTDSATVYITNHADRACSFQVAIGWDEKAGSGVVTCDRSGYVELAPGQCARFVLEELSNYPEKSNDPPYYAEGSKLGESSVVRLFVTGATAGDSFSVSGFSGVSGIKNSSFQELNGSFEPEITDLTMLASAPRVIREEGDLILPESNVTKGKTISAVPVRVIDNFLIIVAVSAVLCIGGLVLYFTHRKEQKYEGKDAVSEMAGGKES